MIFTLPAAFVSFYALLNRHERHGLDAQLPAHVFGVLALAALILREALWLCGQLAPRTSLWPLFTWQLVPATLTLVLVYLDRHRAWPVAVHRQAYLGMAAPVLLLAALASALYANFTHAGGGSALPYVPSSAFRHRTDRGAARDHRLDPKHRLAHPARGSHPHRRDSSGAGLYIVRDSAACASLGQVPFEARAQRLGLAQSLLSFLWTAVALGLMISATRKLMRERWFIGFVLLGVVGAGSFWSTSSTRERSRGRCR